MALDWWDLVSAVIGAVVGAGAAAVPAYWLARKASQETLERDRISRSEAMKAATFRALVKLVTIINGIGSLHRHLEAAVARADADGHANFELWQKIMPITGLSTNEIRFDADDLVAFVTAGQFDYVTELLELAECHISLVSACRDYTRLRKLVTDELATMAPNMEGIVGAVPLTAMERARLQPRFTELNMLVTQMRTYANEYFASAQALSTQFGPNARNALPGSAFPNIGTGA